MKKTKHIMVIGGIALLLLLEAVLVTYGFGRLEEEYIDNYLEQKEQYMGQVNQHLSYMLQQGASQQELVDYMAKEIPVSGSYYAWLAKDNTMIFAKNETVTGTLGEAEAYPVFQEIVQNKETYEVSKTFSYDGIEYVSGLVVDRSYILNQKVLQNFKMFGAISLSVIGLVVISVLIIYIQKFWREQKANLLITEELRNKNNVLDEVYGEVESLNQRIQKQSQQPIQGGNYDLQMARKLLEKSDRAELQPVYYTVVQLQMDKEQYYSKQQIIDIMDQIVLDQRHVRLELQKGCFLVMFYKTQKSEMEAILKKAQATWKKMQVTLQLYSGEITKGTKDRQWLDVFLEGKEKDV